MKKINFLPTLTGFGIVLAVIFSLIYVKYGTYPEIPKSEVRCGLILKERKVYSYWSRYSSNQMLVRFANEKPEWLDVDDKFILEDPGDSLCINY